MKPLPETINWRGESYHRLKVKHGNHDLYGFRRRYLYVDKFGTIIHETNATGLLDNLLQGMRANVS